MSDPTPAEIARRLNPAQKKALLDMPNKQRRMKALKPVDAFFLKGYVM